MTYEQAYAESIKKASVAAKEHAVSTKGAAGATDTFVAKQKKAQAELEATATSSKVAAVGVKTLKLAFNMFSGLVISFAISKIIEGFQYFAESAERAKEKLEDIRTDLTDNQSSYESNRKTLEGLRYEYDSLTKKADELGGVQNLANEEYQRYTEIMSQILGITPKLITGWDDEGNAISNKNGLLQQSIDLLDEEYEKSLRNNTTKAKNEEVATGVITELDEFENSGDTKTASGTKYDLVWKDLKDYVDEAVAKGIDYTYKSTGVTGHDSADIAYAINEFVYGDSLYEATELNTAYGWLGSLQERILSSEESLKQFTESLSDSDNPIYQWFTDEQIDQLIEDSNAYFQELDRIQDDRETYYQKYKDQLNWNAQAATDGNGQNAYKQLSDESKSAITEYINNLDYASIKTSDDFLAMANDVKSFTKTLASDDTFADYINDIYTPQGDDESVEDYSKRVNDAIANVQKYIKDNNLSISLDFGTEDDPKGVQESVDKLQEKYDATINRFKSDASDSSSKELSSLNKQLDEQTQNLTYAKENLQNEYDKISDWGLDDYADQIKNNTIQTKFGNVDMDKRTIIHWSDELKQTYADALASWDYDPEVGSIDTVFGGSERFGEELNGNGWEVAFTPILPDGTFLSKDTVEEYINSILEEVSKGFDDSDKIKDFFDTEGINTDAEIDEFNKVTEGITRADDAIQKWNEHKKEGKNAPSTAFKEAWKSLASDTKKSLTDLAKAGQLTEKAFNKVANTDALTNTGLSVKDLTDKINALVEESKQLSSMKTGITSITSAYDEKKDSKNNVVSSSTLSSMYDTLGVENWTKSNKKAWSEYKKVAGDGTKSLKELRKVQDDLATSYVNSENFLSKLNKTNKEHYVWLLKEMGVKNAKQVVDAQLIKNTEALNLKSAVEAQTKKNLTNLTYDQIQSTSAYNAASQNAKKALDQLYLSENIFNNNKLSLDQKIAELQKYAEAIGRAALSEEAYKSATKAAGEALKNGGSTVDAHKASSKAYLSYYKKHLLDNGKTKLELTSGNKSNGNKNSNNNNSKSKSNSSSSKQSIDWISRAIDVLNNKLDLAKAKYDTLTSLKGKKNNLAEQIKYTTKLINAEKVALSKYTAQYKSVKLDGKLKKAVQEGRLKGSRKQLIATYGEKTANKIQKYQDLYDKAQSARSAIYTQRKNRTDKRIERIQLDVDDADARSSLADARIDNQVSAKQKNVQEEKKYKSTKKSYDNQIKIAKLEKDSVKVATLRAQKEKALLDIRVQEKQNLADEREATYNLNQQLETNAIGYKNKNLYETRSRDSLKEQYGYLIAIAKLQGNTTEQKRLEAELQEKTQSSYMQEVNNIKDDYNNRTSLNESDISTNQSMIEKLQAEGRRVSADFYTTNMDINTQKRQTLVEEMGKLQNQLGTLTPYSSDWYSVKQDINDIAQNINTCDKNTVEWQQAINDLELSKFQLINSQLESTINHLDFLIEMIDEDDMFGKDSGNITSAGITALSLYIDKMNETAESIKNTRAEWNKFQEQVAKGTSGYDEKTIQEKNEAYASSLREAVKANKEIEKSIKSVVENGLNKQKEALDEIISKYKQALDRASELRDYQKDVADQTKNINSIEKRIKALSGNDLSEEARARIQKLTVELNDARDNLQDTQYARWKTDQENMLDDLSDSFEQSITDALANTDSIIEAVQMLVADNGSTVKVYLESMGFGGDSSIVGTKYASDGSYNSTFSTYDGNYVRYNYDMNGNLLSVDTLDSNSNIVSSQQNTNNNTNGTVGTSAPSNTTTAPTVVNPAPSNVSEPSFIDTITTWINEHGRAATGSDASRIAKDPVLAYLNDHSSKRTKKFMISNNEEYELAKLLSGHDSKLAQAIADSKGINPKNMSDKFKRLIANALKNAGYANGGVVSGLKGAIRANGDSLIATVNPRESILTEEFTNMLPKTVDIMSGFNTLPSLIPKSVLSNRNVSQDIKVGDINITVDAPNAYDVNGITQAIKQSTSLQKTLQDATIGQVSKSFNNKLTI